MKLTSIEVEGWKGHGVAVQRMYLQSDNSSIVNKVTLYPGNARTYLLSNSYWYLNALRGIHNLARTWIQL